MPFGTSIGLITVSTIIRYSLTFHVSDVYSRPTIDLILMIAGIIKISY